MKYSTRAAGSRIYPSPLTENGGERNSLAPLPLRICWCILALTTWVASESLTTHEVARLRYLETQRLIPGKQNDGPCFKAIQLPPRRARLVNHNSALGFGRYSGLCDLPIAHWLFYWRLFSSPFGSCLTKPGGQRRPPLSLRTARISPPPSLHAAISPIGPSRSPRAFSALGSRKPRGNAAGSVAASLPPSRLERVRWIRPPLIAQRVFDPAPAVCGSGARIADAGGPGWQHSHFQL